jgi:tetratricopeptide (TPR) repeat protein
MGKKIVLFDNGSAEKQEEKEEVQTTEHARVLIEDIYLIHKGSGKLIQRKTWRIEGETDPDMVAGMFEAVLNFITDAFAKGTQTEFSRFDIKGYTVLLYNGTLVNIAVVLSIEKNFVPSESVFLEIQRTLQEFVRRIEGEYRHTLETWSGEVDALKDTRNALDELSITLNKILSPVSKKIEITDRIFQEAIFDLVRQANIALKKRKYGSALAMLNKCIEMGYAPPEILFNRARALYYCRKYNESLDALSKIAGSMQKADAFWVLKARNLVKLGNLEEARKCIEEALAINPANRDALKLRKQMEG